MGQEIGTQKGVHDVLREQFSLMRRIGFDNFEIICKVVEVLNE